MTIMRLKYFILAAFLLVNTLQAQTVSDMVRLAEPGFSPNARALGMGNAFNALSNDASAMFFNPAGLGQIKRMEMAGGLDYYRTKNEATLFNSIENSSNSNTSFNQAAFVFPFPTVKGSLVFGISYNKTKDFNDMLKFSGYNAGNNSYIQALNESSSSLYRQIPIDLFLASTNNVTNINGKLNQSGTQLYSGDLNNWSFAGAVEVEKNLFFGLNLAVLSGTFTREIDYFEDDINGVYKNIKADPTEPTSEGFKSFNYKNTLDWELSGYEVKLGLLYKLQKAATLGFVLQLPKVYTVKEKFSEDAFSYFINYPAAAIEKPDNYMSDVEYDIKTPFVLTGAGSYSFFGATLAAEVSLTDYTQAKFDNPVNMSSSILSDLNKSIKNTTRAVINYNLGAEYILPDVNARVRIGYFTKQSPYDADPTSFDKKYFTAGFGLMLSPMFLMDVAYMHGWWKDYTDNYYDANGRAVSRVFIDRSIDDLAVSFHYRF